MQVRITPASCRGSVMVPPSKSAAHRALLCAGLAEGTSRIEHLSWSQDILATLDALEALGASIERGNNWVRVQGIGCPKGEHPLWVCCRESGSTLRFLIPLCSLTGQPVTLTGSPRLLERPQDVYAQLFQEQGICFSQKADGILVDGQLRGGHYRLRGDISSQFITGLLLAFPLLEEDSVLELLPPVESRSYIQMTLSILQQFGVYAQWQNDHVLSIPGRQHFHPLPSFTVEGDYSQAAFWGALGAVNGSIDCLGLSKGSAQGDRIFFPLLEKMGGLVQPLPNGCRISPSQLRAGELDLADCPDLGPILTVLAAFCQGESRLFHAGRLRYKESDRIAAMEEELQKLGGCIHSTQDEIFVRGGLPLEGGCTVQSHNDHRIAMSLAIAATRCHRPVIIHQAQAVEKSYPSFWEDLRSVGISVEEFPDP